MKQRAANILKAIKTAANDAANSICGDDAPARREAFRDVVRQSLQEYGIRFGRGINREFSDLAEEMVLQLFGYDDNPCFALHPVVKPCTCTPIEGSRLMKFKDEFCPQHGTK